MNKIMLSAGVGAVLALSGMASDAHEHGLDVFAIMKPANEVPSISSTASASFTATIDEQAQTITYQLKYANLESPPSQAHIHFGQFFANGGVSVFLCGNPPTVPPATVPQPPACPASPATVTGVLTAANVVGPAAQGITAAEFDALVKAIKSGNAYANVHSATFPGGEARGQIVVVGRDRHDD